MLRIMLMVLLVAMKNGCLSMESPRGQFLAFVNEKISSGDLNKIREEIVKRSKGTSSDAKLSKEFIDSFNSCFDKRSMPTARTLLDPEVLYAAARSIGFAFLQKAERDYDLASSDIAVAFFKSIPATYPLGVGGTDSIEIDHVKVAEAVRDNILRRQDAVRRLSEIDTDSLFVDSHQSFPIEIGGE